MKSNLYIFKGFNNYINRKVIKYSAIQEYTNGRSYDFRSNVNFELNNGIQTEYVINLGGKSLDYFNSEDGTPFGLYSPDYLVACNPTTNEIMSRWFVINATRDRQQQYILTLKRDTVADEFKSIMQSPIYFEKGMIKSSSDSAIFNNEGLQVNQIKRSETLIKDYTGIPWLCIFLNGTGTLDTVTIDYSKDVIDIGDITSWEFYNYCDVNPNQQEYRCELQNVNTQGGRPYGIKYTAKNYSSYAIESWFNDFEGFNSEHKIGMVGRVPEFIDQTLTYEQQIELLKQAFRSHYNQLNLFLNDVVGIQDTSKTQRLLDLDGKVIKTIRNGTTEYYKIKIDKNISENNFSYNTTDFSDDNQAYLFNFLKSITSDFIYYSSNNDCRDAVGIDVRYNYYNIQLEKQNSTQYSFNYTIPSTRYKSSDSMYEMLCLPFGNATVVIDDDYTKTRSCSVNSAIQVIKALQTKWSSSQILDIQLLPFCPLSEDSSYGLTIKDNGDISISAVDADKQYSLLGSSGQDTSIIFYVPEANSRFYINAGIDMNDLSIENIKYYNDCVKYRLVSPNYASIYNFNLARNNCRILYYSVTMALKPHNSYIKVSPYFEGLYGNVQDIKGLIFQGNFSIDAFTTSWAQYEVQNKNYANIFNREIQNYDISTKIQKQEAVTGMVGGTVQAGAKGAMTGATAGPIGAIAGAVVGTGVGLSTGIIDLSNTYKMIADNRDMKYDMYNYSLQNIQALPYTLTNISSYTKDNKIFPILEEYTPTEIEHQAYLNMIKYDGMTINRIDYITTFIPLTYQDDFKYFRGQLVRLEDSKLSHFQAMDIYNELSRGVYLGYISDLYE
jgi:hypothetical protein